MLETQGQSSGDHAQGTSQPAPQARRENTSGQPSPRGPLPSPHRQLASETLERSPHGTLRPSPRGPPSNAYRLATQGSKTGSLAAWAADSGMARDYGPAITGQTSVPKPPSAPKYRIYTAASNNGEGKGREAGPSSQAAMQKELEVMRAHTQKLNREVIIKSETVRRVEESLFLSIVEKEQVPDADDVRLELQQLQDRLHAEEPSRLQAKLLEMQAQVTSRQHEADEKVARLERERSADLATLCVPECAATLRQHADNCLHRSYLTRAESFDSAVTDLVDGV